MDNISSPTQKINMDSTLPLTVDQCSPIAMKWLEDIKNIIEPYVNDKECKMFDFTHIIDQSLESQYLLTGEPPSHGIQYPKTFLRIGSYYKTTIDKLKIMNHLKLLTKYN